MVGMSVSRRACFTVRCDGCGQTASTSGRPAHWASVRAAHTAMAAPQWAWVISPASQLCPACGARRLCAQQGHVWGPWAHVVLDVRLEREVDLAGVQLLMERICDRCGEDEITPEDCLGPHHCGAVVIAGSGSGVAAGGHVA